jgi:hypothetical protein
LLAIILLLSYNSPIEHGAAEPQPKCAKMLKIERVAARSGIGPYNLQKRMQGAFPERADEMNADEVA